VKKPPLKLRWIECFLSIILLLSLNANVRAADYYVVKNGNDNNVGSEADPWLTVQKAAYKAVAGDTVYVKSGIYTELVTIVNSGTSGKYITFKRYPGNTVILDGTGNAGWWGIINIVGKSFIKVEGFKIRNNTVGWGVLVRGDGTSEASYIELTGLNVHSTAGEGIQVMADGNSAHHITISGCTVHDGSSVVGAGIDIYTKSGTARPHHVTVTGCTTYNLSGAGIGSERADYLVIENNISRNNLIGIDIGSGDNNIIRYNTVYDIGDLGICISSNEDSLIYNNTIHDILGDGVALYAYYWSLHGEAHARNKYYNNTVYNVKAGIFEADYKQPSGGKGISTLHEYYNNLFYNIGPPSIKTSFWFHGATYIKFYNNTVYMNAGTNGLTFVNGATYHDVRNNVISISGGYFPVAEDISSQRGSTVDYNCYHNRTGSIAGPGTHSVLGDPKFLDPAKKNFRLKSGSPCIDAGSGDAGIPVTDIDGNARCDDLNTPNTGGGSKSYYDIGAYEYKCNARD
jgi:parallel beta-helix repeat protein